MGKLDDNRKRTNKPCHGCGYTPKYGGRGYRYVDEVCDSCKRLMEEAKAWRENLAKAGYAPETVILRGPKSYYDVPSNPAPGHNFDDVYDRFRKALCKLAQVLSDPITAQFEGWRDYQDSLFDKPESEAYEVRWAGLRAYPLDIAGLLQDVEAGARRTVEEAYLKGYEDGTDVVERLQKMMAQRDMSDKVVKLFTALIKNVVEATPKKKAKG